METSTSPRNFAQQISLDEYNTQKKEYTEKALLELKSQMATFKHKPNNESAQSESENDSDDCSSGEQSAGVNVIIKTYTDSTKTGEKDMYNNNKGLRKRRVPSKSIGEGEGIGASAAANSLSNTIYLQRELDLQEIQKLKNQKKQLQNALEEEERKNHFLKLDLCNAQVDNSVLKKDLNVRNNRIKYLENMHHENWWQIVKLKIFIGILVILFIYTFLF
jgi:hypothetical protein